MQAVNARTFALGRSAPKKRLITSRWPTAPPPELVPMTAGRSMSPSAAATPSSYYARWLCPVGSPATEWLGLLATSNTGLSNEKKNPVKLRPVAAGNGLPAVLPRSRNHQRFLAQ